MAEYVTKEQVIDWFSPYGHLDKPIHFETLVSDLCGMKSTDVEPVQEWISVKDRLPEENEYVMIWCGECQIARIEKGISEEQRKAMKRGELDDPFETGWNSQSGYFTLKRSQLYKACDEQGNNRVPYCWYANGGPMKWFGQEVTHWAYLPMPPKGE